jgi:AcrR family transcriptional regulator
VSNLRQRILDAAESLLVREGPQRLTTRAISKAAGCSDTALYRHFDGLDNLLLELFKEKLPSFAALSQLALRVGEGELEENLVEVMLAGLGFLRGAMPIWLALATDPALRKQYFRRLSDEGRGPHRAIDGIAAYLRAEQRLGRVRAEVDPGAVAQAFLSSLVGQAFITHLMGPKAPAVDDTAWCRGVVTAVTRGIEPR